MNKAFVKEPEQSASANCPRCGSLGIAVGEQTLAAHLGEDARAQIAKAAFFCPWPTCGVAYFDTFERTVPVESLARSVWPKDPEAPICACFEFSTDEIDRDIAEGGVTRTRALIERAKSPQAQCLTKSPSGHSCVADVQRYYMQHRGGAD
jgi:hypothetical protein